MTRFKDLDLSELVMLHDALTGAWDGQLVPPGWDLALESRLLAELDAEVGARTAVTDRS